MLRQNYSDSRKISKFHNSLKIHDIDDDTTKSDSDSRKQNSQEQYKDDKLIAEIKDYGARDIVHDDKMSETEDEEVKLTCMQGISALDGDDDSDFSSDGDEDEVEVGNEVEVEVEGATSDDYNNEINNDGNEIMLVKFVSSCCQVVPTVYRPKPLLPNQISLSSMSAPSPSSSSSSSSSPTLSKVTETNVDKHDPSSDSSSSSNPESSSTSRCASSSDIDFDPTDPDEASLSVSTSQHSAARGVSFSVLESNQSNDDGDDEDESDEQSAMKQQQNASACSSASASSSSSSSFPGSRSYKRKHQKHLIVMEGSLPPSGNSSLADAESITDSSIQEQSVVHSEPDNETQITSAGGADDSDTPLSAHDASVNTRSNCGRPGKSLMEQFQLYHNDSNGTAKHCLPSCQDKDMGQLTLSPSQQGHHKRVLSSNTLTKLNREAGGHAETPKKSKRSSFSNASATAVIPNLCLGRSRVGKGGTSNGFSFFFNSQAPHSFCSNNYNQDHQYLRKLQPNDSMLQMRDPPHYCHWSSDDENYTTTAERENDDDLEQEILLSEELHRHSVAQDKENNDNSSSSPIPLLTPPQSPMTVQVQEESGGGTTTATLCEWPSNLAVDNAMMSSMLSVPPMSPTSLQKLEQEEERRTMKVFHCHSNNKNDNTSSNHPDANIDFMLSDFASSHHTETTSTLTPLLKGINVGID